MVQRNVTMVAFHGDKKSDSSLAQLLSNVFEELENAVGFSYSKVFVPFVEDQIHATLIGMEVDIVGGQFYGHWFHQNRISTERSINFQRFVELLNRLAQRKPIFTIRFGGFRKAYCTCVGKSAEGWACSSSGAEFHSCDRSAYEGSFYAYTPGPAVLTGWQVRTSENLSEFPHSLYDFRLAAESDGFLDKYHSDKAPHWMDDDCYIKLGSFIHSVANLGDVEERMRNYLSKRGAVTVDITAEDVSIVLYEDPSLKKEAIIDRILLSDAVADEHRIIQLYHRLLE